MKIIKGGLAVSAGGTRLADIAVADGKIVAVEGGIQPGIGDQIIDAKGCLVFPGFIDAHTHFDLNTGSAVTADDFQTGTLAALAGGTTTVVDFATQDKGMTLKQALRAWHEKAGGKCSCDYAFHMAITDWNERICAELDDMVREGVTSFKLYMAYDALRVDDAQLMDILSQIKRVRGLLGVHCENGTLVNKLVMDLKSQGHVSPAAHPRSRPSELEAEAVSRLLYIARLVDWPVCVVHLSSALGLAEVRKARNAGQTVIVETCPQYLLMNGEVYELPGFEGAKYVCSPPLRTRTDCEALLEVVRGGMIDTIATDHCSFNFKGQKELGLADFSKIPNGLPGVEHRGKLIYTALVGKGLIEPGRMCELLSENPARLYGMYPQKGALLPGSDADIVVWERGIEQPISAGTQYQNVDYTPYEGFVATGRARTVLLGGEVCVNGGKVIRTGLGNYVKRGLPNFG